MAAHAMQNKLGEHKETWNCMHYLSLALFQQGKYVDAEQELRQLVDGKEQDVVST